MRIAVYPGTFDPITNGHLDIIVRSARLFELVIIGVAEENYKNNLFSLDEREALVKEAAGHIPNVAVEAITGLLMDFVHQKQASAIIRGLRALSDFEYEFQMSLMNKRLDDQVETLFLMTATEYSFLSSSIIKQVASLGGDIRGLVPPIVEEAIEQRFKCCQRGWPVFHD